jgi:hypothetical protein
MNSDAQIAAKAREISVCILLICLCGWLCMVYGYVAVPLWLILIPAGAVLVFWSVAFILAFIVWVIFTAKQIEEELEKNREEEDV